MKKGLFVLGITFMDGERGKSAILNISRPLKDIDTGTFKRQVLGESGEINLKYDHPLFVDYDYACKLRDSGALVPRREYEVDTALDYDDPLAGSKVVELIPVDEEIKTHFKASMKQ
ncbi:hypothetical protein MACH09_14420 [Vibrio sp. MACH09]|uniref:DUF1293 family protein n=1 Tax=Vibrio sp. MACH09 TaxID=3025122 RepID=UPI00278EE52E|nr:DUF1293 family protein [Vibrio sp. MACH09]GLO60928.1 hypothetical protein MACH09_14360 [Vibrio sp. MACH09]GLO60934.1 hypothetical protein MACH09_14420 [Vibrio sp. MACH09]